MYCDLFKPLELDFLYIYIDFQRPILEGISKGRCLYPDSAARMMGKYYRHQVRFTINKHICTVFFLRIALSVILQGVMFQLFSYFS